MQYGFLLDHHRCIGCHACTVACKSENDVPVGSFRTWVKYAEKGRFPAVRRHFAVLRCNHCTKPPCVTICPVNALSKRGDGIVDLDRDACIGCRACMQACPYDAIYLNEDSGAAEKCHFCAHRVEQGLQPACVVVCPEQAIVVGDLHDPASAIAKRVAAEGTFVRRPEQRTGPNVHYAGVEPTLLRPGLLERPPTYLWSDRPPHKAEAWPDALPLVPDARVVLDAGHRVEWGWHVALYLVTKGLAAGAALLAPFAGALGLAGWARDWLPEIAALAFTLVTLALLVDDLARPMTFFRLMTRPNPRSWLVIGGWILTAFIATLVAEIALRATGSEEGLLQGLRWALAVQALGVAGYTAFLFAQCEGRDLWQSRWLLPHLLAQAALCGAGLYFFFAAPDFELGAVFVTALALHVVLARLERVKHHTTENARQAAAFLTTVRLGPIAKPYLVATTLCFWIPVALVLATVGTGLPAFAALAAIVALAGLYLYEHAFVRAGQLPPLS